MLKIIRYVAWALLLVLAAYLAYVQFSGPENGSDAGGGSDGRVVALEGQGPVRSFELSTHTGETLNSNDLAGKYRLMYFGYTFCPDKCPLDLAKMTLVLAKLEMGDVPLDKIQPLFITIDPERDTVDAMADTVSLYHEKLIGLTGTSAEIADVASSFGIPYRKVDDDGNGGYLMDHLVAIFLYSPEGRYMTLFGSDDTVNDMVATLAPLLSEGQPAS